MISTGKAARRQFGTRAAAKRAKVKRQRRKSFGSLPISVIAGTAALFVATGRY